MSAEPSDRVFKADGKLREVLQRLAPLQRLGVLEVALVPALHRHDLPGLLAVHGPDILHILCHGAPDWLTVVNDQGEREPLPRAELQACFTGSHDVQLVVLEACNSVQLAEALAPLVPLVVGMQDTLSPEQGTVFTLGLYHALAAGCVVADAVAAGCEDLLGVATQHIPRLCHRPGVDPTGWRLCEPVRRPRAVRALEPVLPPTLRTAGHQGRERCEASRRLEDAWCDPQVGLVNLHGGPGGGKSHFLREWLADMQRRSWGGATRVFGWSFDPLVGGPEARSVRRFLDAALREVLADAARSGDPRADAERLASALRRTPCLLVLDDLETALGPTALGPHVLDPALVELLAGLGRGNAGLCVLATRRPWRRGERVSPPGLTVDAAVELLWARGLTGERGVLAAIAEGLARHPLALELVGRWDGGLAELQAGVVGDGDPLARAWGLMTGTLSEASQEVLAVLAAAERPLGFAELGEVMGRPVEHAELGPLRRAGLVRLDAGADVVALAHRALVTLALQVGRRGVLRRWWAQARRGEQGPLAAVDDLPRLLTAVRASWAAGDLVGGYELYRERAGVGTDPETNHIGRVHGAYFEDAGLLAYFFEGRWADLARGVPEQAEAHLRHRAALALRHMGALGSARPLFEGAIRGLRGAGALRVAMLAGNDLAEQHMFRGDLAAADAALAEAESLADAGDAEEKAYVVRATRGHLAWEQDDLGRAKDEFKAALGQVQATSAYKTLGSRPGYQYGLFLLDRFERAIAAGDEDATSRCQDELDEHFEWLYRWGKERAATVSHAYHDLTWGVYVARCGLAGRAPPRGAGWRDNAEEHLSAAIRLFRMHEHVWMLPAAYTTRAWLRRELRREGPGAASDLEHALAHARRMKMPHAQADALGERIRLHWQFSRRKHAQADQTRALVLLRRHPSPRRMRLVQSLGA